MNIYKIRTANGTREWQADDRDHAIEQHGDSFGGEEGETILDLYLDGASEPQFKPGDRFFSHYSMAWGTVKSENHTVRDAVHGVTGSKLPDTTWYNVVMDNGDTETFDDAHGDWEMARMVPPRVAKQYNYGDDPSPAQKERDNVIATNQIAANAVEPVNAKMRVKRTA